MLWYCSKLLLGMPTSYTTGQFESILLLLTQPLANVPRKAAKDGPYTWIPATYIEF